MSSQISKISAALGLVLLSLASAVNASAAPVLNCYVTTNGNGKDWQKILDQSVELTAAPKGVQIEVPVNSVYGDSFKLTAKATLTLGNGGFPDTVTLSQNVGLPNSIDVFAMEIGEVGAPLPSGNLVDTGTILWMRAHPAAIAYRVGCSIK